MKEEITQLIQHNEKLIQIIENSEKKREEKLKVNAIDSWILRISSGFFVILSIFYITNMMDSNKRITSNEKDISVLLKAVKNINTDNYLTIEKFFLVNAVQTSELIDFIKWIGKKTNIREEELELGRTTAIKNITNVTSAVTTRGSK